MKHKIKISLLTSLYNGEQYLKQYFDNVLKLKNLNETEVIIIHNDPKEEELVIINDYKKKIPFLKHIKVPRENLYKSWNRGVVSAKGDYIAIWNVDDIRSREGVIGQTRILDNNSDVYLVYGNKHMIRNSNGEKTPVISKAFSDNIKLKKFQDGAFLMWRKKIHKKIGYFDEQFYISGDQDFWYRVTDKFRIYWINIILGEFADIPNIGLSKTSKNIGAFERIVIGLRYYFFSPIDVFLIPQALKKYKVKKYLNFDKYYVININNYNYYILLIGVFKSLLFSLLMKVTPNYFNKIRGYL